MSDTCGSSGQDYLSDCDLLAAYRNRSRDKAQMKNDPMMKVLLEKAKQIQLLLLDVDGVLSDGTLSYTEDGGESKSFHTQDGFGLRLLQEAGIATGVITARSSEIVARRCTELKMQYVYQQAKNKNQAFKEILSQSGLAPYQIAYMGDDWLDLVLLQQVGLALAPANAVMEVREAAHYTTPRAGGHGAVRDACDLIITGHDKMQELLQRYRNR